MQIGHSRSRQTQAVTSGCVQVRVGSTSVLVSSLEVMWSLAVVQEGCPLEGVVVVVRPCHFVRWGSAEGVWTTMQMDKWLLNVEEEVQEGHRYCAARMTS